jgi:hypothetical protein
MTAVAGVMTKARLRDLVIAYLCAVQRLAAINYTAVCSIAVRH